MIKGCTPLLFVSGFGTELPPEIVATADGEAAGYLLLDEAFKTSGFRPTYHSPDWRGSRPGEWEEAALQAAEEQGSGMVLAGFSLGALIALRVAARMHKRCGGVAMIEPSSMFHTEVPLECDGQTADLRTLNEIIYPRSRAYCLGEDERGSRMLPGVYEALYEQGLPDAIQVPLQIYTNTGARSLMRAIPGWLAERYTGTQIIEYSGEGHDAAHPAVAAAISGAIGELALNTP
jgi:pimeloyl-ACP methyl ester carboxylesterase